MISRREAIPETHLTPGERLRNLVFWLRDYARGSSIARELVDIHNLMIKPDLRSWRLEEDLESLLKHATDTVPFYQDYKGCELRDFPILTKDLLKKNFESFFSSSFQRNSLHNMTTTGSYGTPFTFYLSPQKRSRQLAEIVYFSGWAGYRVGMRYAQMRGTKHSGFRSFLQNEVLMNPWRIDEEWLRINRQHLLGNKIRFLFEYPSPMTFLAEYCRNQGDKPDSFQILGACTSSENLTDQMRQSISEVFGATVLSRYASQENGVLAHEHPDYGTKMLINEASQYLELLSLDSDQQVQPGQTGRIVVTDLYSHAMPLIRYDIGDTAVFSDKRSELFDLGIIERLEGRIIETLFSVSGDIISPYLLVTGLWGIEGMIQYQFIQKTEQDYLMRVVLQKGATCEKEIRNRLMPFLGLTANLEVESTDHIEPLPSGKRPTVINEWKMK